MSPLDKPEPPHGDIFIANGTKGAYHQKCNRCDNLFLPTFYNPNNLIGFGKWTRNCGTCLMLNLMDFIENCDEDDAPLPPHDPAR